MIERQTFPAVGTVKEQRPEASRGAGGDAARGEAVGGKGGDGEPNQSMGEEADRPELLTPGETERVRYILQGLADRHGEE